MDEVMRALLRSTAAEGPLPLTEERSRRRDGWIRIGQDTARRAERRGLVTIAPDPRASYSIIATITDKGRAADAAVS